MPRHIFRLVLLIAACAVLAYGAKRVFTVSSFYEYGHYRGDSVAEIASDKPKYKGVGYCAQCHAEQVADWFKGVHNSANAGRVVKCADAGAEARAGGAAGASSDRRQRDLECQRDAEPMRHDGATDARSGKRAGLERVERRGGEHALSARSSRRIDG